MRYARKKAGFKLTELSRRSGVGVVTIQGWENDRATPSIRNVELCADVLGLSIDEYVGHVKQEGEKIEHKETKAEIKQREKQEKEEIKQRQRYETLRAAINTFGIPRQEDVAIEEMSELTKAIIKNRRSVTKSHKDDIREEIADVFIMITQLKMMYGENIDKIIDRKIERLQQRLEDNSYER